MNLEAFKEISRTRGRDRAQEYRWGRKGAGLRAVDQDRASKAHLREALSGEINSASEEVGQRPQRVWAVVDLELSSIAAITSDGTLIAEPLVNQPRQVGQGLSFG